MSTSKQDTSIPDQKGQVSSFCAGKNQIVEEYVDEGKSGSKDIAKRVRFLEMVEDLTKGKWKGKVKTIVCLDLSRFGRLDSQKGALHKVALRSAGVKLETVRDGIFDWNNATSRIVDCVKSEGNHDLCLTIAEKGLRNRIRVTKEGRPNQTTPYGMAKEVTSPTGEKITVQRNQRFATPKTWKSVFVAGEPSEVEGVQLMYSSYHQQDLSFSRLAAILMGKGYPPPSGGNVWRADTVQWMLSNPVYAGGLRIGFQGKGEFFRVHDGAEVPTSEIEGASEPVVVWETHQGIVDRALWDAVQAKIKKNFKTRRPPRNHGPYALTGLIHCGNCGLPMYGAKNSNGVNIYRCHRNEINPGCACGYWIAYEPQVLPFVLDRFLKDIEQEIVSMTAQPVKEDEAARLRKELAALDKKLQKDRERYLDAPNDVATGLLPLMAEREAQRKVIAEKLQCKKNQDPISKMVAWWKDYSCMKGMEINRTITKKAGPYRCEVKLKIPPAVLRANLQRINAKVYAWWLPKKKGRGYDLAKLRCQASFDEKQVCYEWASKAAS